MLPICLVRGSLHRSISAFPVTGLGLPGRSYRATCGWLLPMLDLEAYGRVLTLNRGQRSSIGPGAAYKMPTASCVERASLVTQARLVDQY